VSNGNPAEVLERLREEHTAHAEYRVQRRFVQARDGRDYVTYPGLLDLAHQVSEGRFEIATTLAQVPTQENGMVAIVTAQAILFDNTAEGQELRRTSGIGDASPQNVNRAMGAHLIRMAETRAKARALRDLLNVGAVALEELGPAEEVTPSGARTGGGPTDEPKPAPPRPSWPERREAPAAAQPAEERILVNGRAYTREAVWDAYTKRRAQARERVPAHDVGETGKQPHDPLPVLVAATQSIRKKLEGAPGK